MKIQAILKQKYTIRWKNYTAEEQWARWLRDQTFQRHALPVIHNYRLEAISSQVLI